MCSLFNLILLYVVKNAFYRSLIMKLSSVDPLGRPPGIFVIKDYGASVAEVQSLLKGKMALQDCKNAAFVAAILLQPQVPFWNRLTSGVQKGFHGIGK